MDRTSAFILLVCFILLLSWGKISRSLFPTPPAPPAATNQVAGVEGTNAVAPILGDGEGPRPGAAPSVAVAPQEPRRPETLLTLAGAKAIYTFTSHGGGIKQIELTDYAAVACAKEAEALDDGHFATLNTNVPLPILSIRGSPAIEGANDYTLSRSNDTVYARSTLTNGLRIIKEFTLSATNYLLATRIHFENTTDQAVTLPEREVVIGTAAAASPGEDSMYQGSLWSDGEDEQTVEQRYFDNKTLGCFPGTPRHFYTVSDPNLKWAAVYSQFFAIAAIPTATNGQFIVSSVTTPKVRIADANEEREWKSIWEFTEADFISLGSLGLELNTSPERFFQDLLGRMSPATRRLIEGYDGRSPLSDELAAGILADLNALLPTAALYEDHTLYFAGVANSGELRMLAERKPAGVERARFNRILIELALGKRVIQPSPKGHQASFSYPAAILGPKETSSLDFEFYTGPKEYYSLSKLAEERGNDLDKVMSLNGFFGMFSKLLLLSMSALHKLGLPYGLCIIAITIIIKLLFWPLTQASTRSMKRMAKLQPQMKAIQEKHKDDPQKGQVEMLKFMKTNKVSPVASCLPVLIQFPFFIGFFKMIKTAIELRGASFLWACDLSSPDTLFHIPGLGWIPFLGEPGLGFPVNPMPIMMGVSMIYQMRLTPQSPTMDPMQQKILRYMPVMFMFILYGYSSGLTLYWTVNNILSIIQTKLVRNEDDTAAAPGPDGSGKPAGASAGPVSPAAEPPKKTLAPKGGTSGRKGLGARKKKKKKNDPQDPGNRRP